MFKIFDELKARKFINLMQRYDGKPGVDLIVDDLDEDILKLTVMLRDKTLLKTKINLESLSERTMDEISYVTSQWI